MHLSCLQWDLRRRATFSEPAFVEKLEENDVLISSKGSSRNERRKDGRLKGRLEEDSKILVNTNKVPPAPIIAELPNYDDFVYY